MVNWLYYWHPSLFEITGVALVTVIVLTAWGMMITITRRWRHPSMRLVPVGARRIIYLEILPNLYDPSLRSESCSRNQILARPEGFEPPAYGFEVRRSIRAELWAREGRVYHGPGACP